MYYESDVIVEKVTIEFHDGSVDEITDEYTISQLSGLLSYATWEHVADVKSFLNEVDQKNCKKNLS